MAPKRMEGDDPNRNGPMAGVPSPAQSQQVVGAGRLMRIRNSRGRGSIAASVPFIDGHPYYPKADW